MNPSRWQQVKSVLTDALDRGDTMEREAFLASACAGDTSLRREVDSLLSHSGALLDACVDELSRATTEAAESTIGGRFGAYRIVRELARGGMGAVYLASRADEQFQKEVAIKLLKRGTDTDEVLRRFRAEREILARLEHPNIARLIDGGTTDDGLPYFVMEHVVGTRITDFCFANDSDVAERLQLFLKVCAALQFAHQNLVVHRDIKPANILVTADGEPKLLDFGIAKLLDPTDGPIDVTMADRQRLTPAYASPEQVRGEAITTVSDVYSLGALLFELLTGQTPHRFSTGHPSATELLRVVVEQEPPRPSAVAADQRKRQLRGDLDRIVLKALRKEPAERYPGVGSFGEDIRRYLAGLPVRARPATFGYRAGKFLRRNKGGVLVGSAAVITLLAGTAITIVNARRAESEALRAAGHFNDVRQLANSFLFEFHDEIATLPGATAARRLVVNRALEYLDKLGREAAGDRQLQLELAEAYLKIGDVQGKPYTANLGDSAGALASYEKAVAIASPLTTREASSGGAHAQRLLSNAYLSLAAVQTRLNQLDTASQNSSRALAIAEQLLARHPENADAWRRLITACHSGLGDAIQAGNHQRRDPKLYHAATEHYRRALTFAEEVLTANPESVPDIVRLAKACARIAGMLPGMDAPGTDPVHFRESVALHDRNLALISRALELEPHNSQLRRNMAGGLIAKAYASCTAVQHLAEATNDSARALQIFEELAAADPLNAEAQQDLSYGHYVKGWAHHLRGETAVAADHYRESIKILEPLVQRHPDNLETAHDLAEARRGLAEIEGSIPNR